MGQNQPPPDWNSLNERKLEDFSVGADDLTMFDFAGEYAQDSDRALYRLQFLLLDEDICLARVALLRAMVAARKPDSASGQEEAESFGDEIALLCEEGLFTAHASGRLTPERVRRLQRLTGNADALLEVHRRLVGDDAEDASSAWAVSDT